jgi:hypothetical protein
VDRTHDDKTGSVCVLQLTFSIYRRICNSLVHYVSNISGSRPHRGPVVACGKLCSVYAIIGRNVTIKLAVVLVSFFSLFPCIANRWDLHALDGILTHHIE